LERLPAREDSARECAFSCTVPRLRPIRNNDSPCPGAAGLISAPAVPGHNLVSCPRPISRRGSSLLTSSRAALLEVLDEGAERLRGLRQLRKLSIGERLEVGSHRREELLAVAFARRGSRPCDADHDYPTVIGQPSAPHP